MPFLVFLLVILVSSPCLGQMLDESVDQGLSQMPDESTNQIWKSTNQVRESTDQVWEVGDRRWTVEEERRFEKWVDETITEDFFIRYEIPTDCADAVYAIRWIYARINHLPAAATTRDGKWIGHWSTDWKHIPTHPEWYMDARFRAALRYLFPMTWTGTLPFDTYPVRISSDSVTPGTLFLLTESHTGMIGHVFLDGSQAHPLQTWESGLPVRVRKLSMGYFFSMKPESSARSGLVKFRWPISKNGEWKYLPVQEHPFYSEEQYTSDFCKDSADFVEAVARRIDPTNYAPMEKLLKVMGTITRYLKERIPIVLTGYEQCHDGDCPDGSEAWEIHSTPGRDGIIISLMDHLSKIIESNHLDRGMVKRMMEAIPINISENRSVTFYDVYQNHLWLSPDPEHSIEARWGLNKCEMIHAQRLTTKNSIAFIERVYRKKDPKYADFSILQQQRLLGKLSEEWVRSECREPLPTVVKKARLSPPPKGLIEARWGLEKCEMIKAQIRVTNDSITFIEKTYRKKDPEYADFSIRQQRVLLAKLSEGWITSECKEPPPMPEKKGWLSPPRKDSIETRRGLKRCEAIHEEIRAVNDSIAFIEKTYRMKDPEYADFSIRQQHYLLGKLREEWTGLECGESPSRPEQKAGK